ncbi:MAG: AAA family ATPase [Syntrophaceae bacterium]|nr:AAA family ATPase [Syntrophaceae bacterium]
MMKQVLILRNPMRQLGFEQDQDEILPPGGFGAVLAHAGVGKTAFLVQLALNGMLRSRNVLHISLSDPVNKVTIRYRELFQRLAGPMETREVKQLWDSLLPHRFIMTFREVGFTAPKLEERLNDLTVQGIFKPEMMIIDGLHCDPPQQALLTDLKGLAVKLGVSVWFTVHTHRHLPPGPDGLPDSFQAIACLFDLLIELQAKQSDVHIKILRSSLGAAFAEDLLLDPGTMLIKEQA